ncbi:MAG: hypothetical protein ACRD3Q_08575, partial [Terriglobales bacterium]
MTNSPQRGGGLYRAMRMLRRIAIWGALSLFALFLSALAINAFDEQPSPLALELSQPPPNRYKPEENIYLALVGLDAPAGQSVVTVGQAKVRRYNEQVNSQLRDPLAGLTPDDPQRLKFSGSIECCRPRERNFWEAVRANGPKFGQLIDQNRELYERYLALSELSGYYETSRPSVLAPIPYVPSA